MNWPHIVIRGRLIHLALAVGGLWGNISGGERDACVHDELHVILGRLHVLSSSLVLLQSILL